MAVNFRAFKTKGRECSIYKNIPITMLEAFRNAFPGKYRIRYRGPRNDYRYASQRQAECLRAYANRFSVYLY